jgi:hypothetical protein
LEDGDEIVVVRVADIQAYSMLLLPESEIQNMEISDLCVCRIHARNLGAFAAGTGHSSTKVCRDTNAVYKGVPEFQQSKYY